MSDYFLMGAVVPAGTDLTDLGTVLAPTLDPYIDETLNWWATGHWAAGAWSDYNPTADPANWATCEICHGTGRRDDERGGTMRSADPGFTCNGCAGPGVQLAHVPTAARPAGTRLKSPYEWRAHPGDIVPLERLLDPVWRFRPGIAPEAYATPTGWHSLDPPSDGTLGTQLRALLTARHTDQLGTWALAVVFARPVPDLIYRLPDTRQPVPDLPHR